MAFESHAFDIRGGYELKNPLGPITRTFTQNPDGKFHRWYLAANVHASRTTQSRSIEWRHDDVDFPNMTATGPGNGHGQGFLDTLEPGHRICIVIRTEVRLRVFYSLLTANEWL